MFDSMSVQEVKRSLKNVSVIAVTFLYILTVHMRMKINIDYGMCEEAVIM